MASNYWTQSIHHSSLTSPMEGGTVCSCSMSSHLVCATTTWGKYIASTELPGRLMICSLVLEATLFWGSKDSRGLSTQVSIVLFSMHWSAALQNGARLQNHSAGRDRQILEKYRLPYGIKTPRTLQGVKAPGPSTKVSSAISTSFCSTSWRFGSNMIKLCFPWFLRPVAPHGQPRTDLSDAQHLIDPCLDSLPTALPWGRTCPGL